MIRYRFDFNLPNALLPFAVAVVVVVVVAVWVKVRFSSIFVYCFLLLC